MRLAAARVRDISPSLIRVVSDGAPKDAMPLGIGEPTWPFPEIARRALADVPEKCPYGPNAGLDELREVIAKRHRVAFDGTVITNGSQEALYSLLQAWVDPGTAVLVPDPGFVAYANLVKLAGARTALYAVNAADRFRLDADALIAALDATPDASAVILNHPSNPTGAGASLEALKRVAEACRARDVLLISDEVYRELHFGTPVPSLRDASDYGCVISSVSKGFASPGLRVGWIAGDTRWLQPARILHSFNVTAAAWPAQRAALALLARADEVLETSRREIRARFDVMQAAMREFAGREILPPDGAFYHWMPLPTRAHADPIKYCLMLRDEAKVVVVPGLAFGERGRGFARASFGASLEQIREGVKRLAPHLT
jgi:aspartate/methionine/tyrosine aminotransferase